MILINAKTQAKIKPGRYNMQYLLDGTVKLLLGRVWVTVVVKTEEPQPKPNQPPTAGDVTEGIDVK